MNLCSHKNVGKILVRFLETKQMCPTHMQRYVHMWTHKHAHAHKSCTHACANTHLFTHVHDYAHTCVHTCPHMSYPSKKQTSYLATGLRHWQGCCLRILLFLSGTESFCSGTESHVLLSLAQFPLEPQGTSEPIRPGSFSLSHSL